MPVNIFNIALEVHYVSHIIHYSDSNVKTIERLTGQLATDSSKKIEEFQKSLKQLNEKLCSHIQIEGLVITSRIRDDVSRLGKLCKTKNGSPEILTTNYSSIGCIGVSQTCRNGRRLEASLFERYSRRNITGHLRLVLEC